MSPFHPSIEDTVAVGVGQRAKGEIGELVEVFEVLRAGGDHGFLQSQNAPFSSFSGILATVPREKISTPNFFANEFGEILVDFVVIRTTTLREYVKLRNESDLRNRGAYR